MSVEEEFVTSAKKYIPNLSEEQENLVRSIAKCKKYGSLKPHPYFGAIPGKEEYEYSLICDCSLCLRLKFYELKSLFSPSSNIPK